MFARRRACYVVVLCVPISYRGGGGGGRGVVIMRCGWWRCGDAICDGDRGRGYVRTYIYVPVAKGRRTDQGEFLASALFFDKNKEIFASRPRPSAARSKSLPAAALNRRMQDLGYSDPFVGDDNKEHLQNIQESLPRLPRNSVRAGIF